MRRRTKWYRTKDSDGWHYEYFKNGRNKVYFHEGGEQVQQKTAYVPLDCFDPSTMDALGESVRIVGGYTCRRVKYFCYDAPKIYFDSGYFTGADGKRVDVPRYNPSKFTSSREYIHAHWRYKRLLELEQMVRELHSVDCKLELFVDSEKRLKSFSGWQNRPFSTKSSEVKSAEQKMGRHQPLSNTEQLAYDRYYSENSERNRRLENAILRKLLRVRRKLNSYTREVLKEAHSRYAECENNLTQLIGNQERTDSDWAQIKFVRYTLTVIADVFKATGKSTDRVLASLKCIDEFVKQAFLEKYNELRERFNSAKAEALLASDLFQVYLLGYEDEAMDAQYDLQAVLLENKLKTLLSSAGGYADNVGKINSIREQLNKIRSNCRDDDVGEYIAELIREIDQHASTPSEPQPRPITARFASAPPSSPGVFRIAAVQPAPCQVLSDADKRLKNDVVGYHRMRSTEDTFKYQECFNFEVVFSMFSRACPKRIKLAASQAMIDLIDGKMNSILMRDEGNMSKRDKELKNLYVKALSQANTSRPVFGLCRTVLGAASELGLSVEYKGNNIPVKWEEDMSDRNAKDKVRAMVEAVIKHYKKRNQSHMREVDPVPTAPPAELMKHS